MFPRLKCSKFAIDLPPILLVGFYILIAGAVNGDNLSVSKSQISTIVGEKTDFQLYNTEPSNFSQEVKLIAEHHGILNLAPTEVIIPAGHLTNTTINLIALIPGKTDILLEFSNRSIATNANESGSLPSNTYVRVTIGVYSWLIIFSEVCGWLYFVAWSVSFYPQIYLNWKRKSVIGLNFDFVALNIVGFTLYSLFNCGLYWNEVIQKEFHYRYPRSLNPVLLNDVIFSLHATFATFITIFQCFIYESNHQRVSRFAVILLNLFAAILLSIGILSGVEVTHWLDFLYACSYIKLAITLIKYIPQALMNHRRRSTLGWSIGNIFLDCTGGLLSMLQMIINAYNYDDWISIFGDPTKFGLGLFSVLMDMVFIVQHYILYR